ncbi:hypothetical protein BJ912DRAFT_635392 [Pholiota molesta]|nr:hypothetical protein BJ912DRAFT_635392 [Pholiota molesta]
MDQTYNQIALETAGHSLVGMHPVKFVDESLPWNTSTPEAYKEKAATKSRLTRLRLVPCKPGKFESMMNTPFNSYQEVSSRTAPEADIYHILEDAKVEHVASMRLRSDLQTETQTWFSELTHNSRLRNPARMVCHRIVLDTVARDLSTFSWCKVLLSCVADAVEGAQQAYAAAGVLHRDISSSNITIAKDKKTQERRGILIDWDMSSLSQTHEGEAHARRIGTWAFTSATISRTPGRAAHTLWDSTESAFWVLLHHALHYLKHTSAPHPLHHLLTRLFHERPATCVSHKETVLIFCAIRRKHKILPQFRIPGLNAALEDLGGSLTSAISRKSRRWHRRTRSAFPSFSGRRPWGWRLSV